MTTKPEPAPTTPPTLAEGGSVPTMVPPMPAEALRAAKPAPTDADYRREHGTYVATANLIVDGNLAIVAGGSVPMSHPHLQAGPWGDGWIADGVIARVDGEPIEGAPIAVEAQQAYPGQYPG